MHSTYAGSDSALLGGGSVLGMSNQYSSASPVHLTAGTAIKIGFFGAFGAFLFSLILSVVALIVAVILAAVGFSVFSNLNLN